MVQKPVSYVGRFAPSPTGPLHFGSLVSALASYLDAKSCGGQWLLRIEDIDPPREQPGASRHILRQLAQHGLGWDGTELYQSHRTAAYLDILHDLRGRGLLYPCTCSRLELQRSCGIHLAPCRASTEMPEQDFALRLAVPANTQVEFFDLFQGKQRQDISAEVGDFVLRRKDGLFAYQLAVVVDEAYQGVTHIIRGADLLDSTARQIHLQQVLDYATPCYGHVPIAINAQGQKLSKQNHAPSLDAQLPIKNLSRALTWLGYELPADLADEPLESLLGWAIKNWRRERLVGVSQKPEIPALEPDNR